MTPEPDRSRLELRPPEEERLRALRSQRRSAIPRGCLWWSAWLVVGAGIWVAGILIVASVLAAAPRSAPVQPAQSGAPLDPARVPAAVIADVRPVGTPGAPYQTAPYAVEKMLGSGIMAGGAPRPLAAVTASESIAMPAGSFASPAAVSHGIASWYAARGYQGAVPWWKAGQSPVWATLSRFADGRTYSVTLLITGFCACLAGQPGERLIDLSPAAFRALGAPLSVGLLEVTMEVPVQGPRLPATDEEGPE